MRSLRYQVTGISAVLSLLRQNCGNCATDAGAVVILAGGALLSQRPWARVLDIIRGCFTVVDMPFGTALGVYTLWVLLPAKSEEEYRQIAKAA